MLFAQPELKEPQSTRVTHRNRLDRLLGLNRPKAASAARSAACAEKSGRSQSSINEVAVACHVPSGAIASHPVAFANRLMAMSSSIVAFIQAKRCVA